MKTRHVNIRLLAGLALLIVVLAGAAYVGAGLLGKKDVAQQPGKPGAAAALANPAGGKQPGRSFDVEPAGELPQNNPDAIGVVSRRQDNSLFLLTDKPAVNAWLSAVRDGGDSAAQVTGVPAVEVVIARETKIWRDATDAGPNMVTERGTIEQVVQAGSIDELLPTSIITVWGERRGGRLIARALVYVNP